MLPRHARLQNMTCSSRMKKNISVEVYTRRLVTSDKTGKDQYVDEDLINQDNRDVFIGRLPVMVNSDLCWMKDEQKRDSEFDHGGYFLIKGAEKIFIVQEQICLRRLLVSNIQGWTGIQIRS